MNMHQINELTGYTFILYMTCLVYLLNLFYRGDTFCVKKIRNIYLFCNPLHAIRVHLQIIWLGIVQKQSKELC